MTSIDSILGPRDGVDLQSTSSEGSYPNSLSPEPVSSDPVFPESSKERSSSDTTVVTSISVEVNQHEKGLPPLPIPPETLDVPQEGEQKNGINRDSTIKVTETSEVIVPAMGSPHFSLPIVTSGDSSEDDSSDSDDDDENMLRGTPPPKSGDLSAPKSSSPDSFVKNDSPHPPKSPSPPTPAIEIENVENNNRQPNSNGVKEEHNNNILNSPTPDRRRPSGKDLIPKLHQRIYFVV